MIGLTHRQADALRFIAGYVEKRGEAPTLAEVMLGIGTTSTSLAHGLLAGLDERGAISRIARRKRAISVNCQIPIPRAPDGAPLYFVKVTQ